MLRGAECLGTCCLKHHFQKKTDEKAYLIESRQGHDAFHQVLPVQVNQHSALTGVQKMQLEGYQLC